MKYTPFNKLENLLIVEDTPRNISAAKDAMNSYSELRGMIVNSPEKAIAEIDQSELIKKKYDSAHGFDAVITDLDMNGEGLAGLDVVKYSLENHLPAFVATQRDLGGNHGYATNVEPLMKQYGAKSDESTWKKIIGDVREWLIESDEQSPLPSTFVRVFSALKGEALSNFLMPTYLERLNIDKNKYMETKR